MIFFLILGVLLGVVSIIFVLQNTTVVTVVFLTWQMQGSLALVLFVAIALGILITLLVLLPSFIRDAFALAAIRKEKKQLQDELLAKEHALNTAHASTTQQSTQQDS